MTTTPTPAIAEGEPMPCPWGHPAEVCFDGDELDLDCKPEWWVICRAPAGTCPVSPCSFAASTRAEAIAAWNRRPSPEGRREVLEAALEEISQMLPCERPCEPRPDCRECGSIGGGWCAGCVSRAALAASAAPEVPKCLRTMTPEERTTFQPLTDEQIETALREGQRAVDIATGRIPAPCASTDPAALQATPARTGEGPLTREEVATAMRFMAGFWGKAEEEAQRLALIDSGVVGAIAYYLAWSQVRGSLRTGEREAALEEAARVCFDLRGHLGPCQNEACVALKKAAEYISALITTPPPAAKEGSEGR